MSCYLTRRTYKVSPFEPGNETRLRMRAAFFDMDRTLIRVNTGRLYVRWRFQRKEASIRDVARFARWMVQYKFGIVDPDEVSRRASRTLKGVSESNFENEIEEWFKNQVEPEISNDARREVERCRGAGYTPVILSASTRYATTPLARTLEIDHVLCTELEVQNGVLTGGLKQLCYGEGKVHQAEKWAKKHNVDLAQSLFYTDSVSDIPMLERVGLQKVVNPDPRLRLRAKQEGWPILRWR